MNKISSLLVAACAIAGAAVAQHTPAAVYHYSAEGRHYYQLQGYPPASDVGFYSDRSGGRLLQEHIVGAEGTLLIDAPENFKPVFVLNKLVGKKAPGNGKVRFIEEQAFTIDNIAVKQEDGRATISWEASVADREKYSFTILQRDGNGNELPVAFMQAHTTAPAVYSKTLEVPGGSEIFYRVRISNSDGTAGYTTGVLAIAKENKLKVYPTLAKGEINVSYAGAGLQTPYVITNMMGTVLQTGMLESELATVPLKELPPGSYMLKVVEPATGKPLAVKFVKQ